jgi:hypothetical protein
MLELFLM